MRTQLEAVVSVRLGNAVVVRRSSTSDNSHPAGCFRLLLQLHRDEHLLGQGLTVEQNGIMGDVEEVVLHLTQAAGGFLPFNLDLEPCVPIGRVSVVIEFVTHVLPQSTRNILGQRLRRKPLAVSSLRHVLSYLSGRPFAGCRPLANN